MTQDAEEWQRRSTSKNEIADVIGLSRNFLFRKVHKNSELMRRLETCNYNKRQRLLTPRQCRILIEYFCVTEV